MTHKTSSAVSKIGIAVLAISSVLASAHSSGAEPDATLVIKNAQVVVGNGQRFEHATIVIGEDRILKVSREALPSLSVTEIDAQGKTVMPGLIDTHVHFFGLTQRGENAFRAELRTRAPKYMGEFLRHGVTTVRSMADPLGMVTELRDMVEDGEMRGPRVLFVGPCFTAPGGHPAVTLGQDDPWMREEIAVEVADANSAKDAVRRLAEKGVDAIKAAVEGGRGIGLPNRNVPALSDSVLRAIVEEAHERGLKVAVHTHRERDVLRALLAGADAVEHGVWDTTVTGDELSEVLTKHGAYYTPTLWAFSLDSDSDYLGHAKRNLKHFSDRGVRIALGTDSLASMPNPGLNTIREMELMAEAGLTPNQIIQAATRNAAEHIGRLDDLGTIEPGKIADLILVDGNPLEDISTLRKIDVVIQSGKVVDDVGKVGPAPQNPVPDTNPVGWFEIPVTDMPRAIGFYEYVLQIKFQRLNLGFVDMALFPKQSGKAGASGALMKGEAFQPSDKGVQIYFDTENIEGILKRVEEREGKIVLPKTSIGPFGFIGSFVDSEGNRVGLRSSQ